MEEDSEIVEEEEETPIVFAEKPLLISFGDPRALRPVYMPSAGTQPAALSNAFHHIGVDLENVVDGNGRSRFDTGTSQVPGMWFQVELPETSTVNRILLDSAGSSRDYPRGYEVQASLDGKKWSSPISKGAGRHPLTDIIFPLTQAKYLKIMQTGSAPSLYWSIHEMQIYGKPIKLN